MFVFKYVRKALLYPNVWYFCAMLTYCISCGGVVYGIIHNNPWFKFENDEFGKPYVSEYFMKGQHGQWSGEGYIFTSLLALLGFALIAITKLDKYFTNAYVLRIAVLVNLGVVFLIWQAILIVYRYKQPWYNP